MIKPDVTMPNTVNIIADAESQKRGKGCCLKNNMGCV